MKEIAPKLTKHVLIKFFLVLVLFGGYFVYLSYEFDLLTGGVSSLLTWSFFVLCTPVADAGFLLDFPLRLLFGIRMIISEIVVWIVAILFTAGTLILKPFYYETTLITKLLKQIVITPYPYWGVIGLSAIGTFLSIRFGDELMDVIHHRDRTFFHSHHFKHELILVIFFVVALFGYYELIKSLEIADKL
jgi:hypothetical protein